MPLAMTQTGHRAAFQKNLSLVARTGCLGALLPSSGQTFAGSASLSSHPGLPQQFAGAPETELV